ERLALAPGAQDQDLVRLVLVELVGPDHEVVARNLDVAEVAGDVEVLAHRAPDDRDLPPDLRGDVDRLLHPVHVRGERRDEDAALAPRNDLAERLSDEALRAGEAGPLGVRR